MSDRPGGPLFDVHAWRARHQILREAEGRGAAYFLRAGAETVWVLRHYRRGGMLAPLNRDRYAWVGASASRPARELRLLAALYNRGLPVPRPVAARAVRRRGVTYTADLITEAIAGTRALADCLGEQALDLSAWQDLGAVIACMHQAGVWHADLNARNVLIDGERRFHLIDFDRARFRGDGAWREANLKRFRRSLDKFGGRWATFHFTEDDWQALLAGYRAAFGRL
ncbi:MAG: 3-deoxy-D-manno-octulosonic acid kinase [Salinisphaera sp.]|uniref:3-deoxy-D-manno-octulosonic acid kinase n=1 Tax=Salinisphaera sp. TaxID=1914330 RepID=UPI003C799C47